MPAGNPPLKWIDIDLGIIRRNLEWVRGRLAPTTRLMAVVKANSYGHGAGPVARLALKAGASCLGALTLDEALELRREGVRAPIVLLSPPLPEQAPAVVAAGLEATIDSKALLAALDRAAGKINSRGAGRIIPPDAARLPVPIHVDLDFGLRRWGIAPDRLPQFLESLKRRKYLRLAGLSTHFDYVPGKNAVEAEDKLRAFERLAAKVKAEHPGIVCHAANSSVFLDFPQWHLDMVRIGNLMYGINPTSTAAPLQMPWKFFARIIALNTVGKGRAIGYASEYVAPRRMTVATLPVGYSDGLTMAPAERLIGFGKGYQYWGLLRGRKTPFVGRCAISHVLVDVSRVPRPRIGEPVELPIRRTAASPRIPRLYLTRS